MSEVSRKIFTSLLLASALVGVQAQAEIQTSIITDTYKNSDEVKNFSKNTPCSIIGAKDHPESYAKVVQIFKDIGFNITDDESVECRIMLISEIAYDKSSSEKSFYPNDVLNGKMSWPDTLVNPNPSIVAKVNAAKSQIADSKKPGFGADGINIMTQVGGLINGSAGASALGGAGVVLNLLGGFLSQPTTPEGMESTSAYVSFGHFLRHTHIDTKVYAASDTPQKPDDLFYAGVKRAAEAIEAAIYECHINHKLLFDMPIPTPENSKIRPPALNKTTAADTQAKTEQDQPAM
jgi:hypothetical protein